MLSIELEAQDEYIWAKEGDNPSPTTFPIENGIFPLYHQWLTYNAEEPIIVNTYNTGTGKTKAALLRLLRRAQMIGFDRIRPSRDNALLIAPTNELLAQHVSDAQQFCKENGLPYRVLALTKADLDEYMQRPNFSEERLRRGAVLHYIIDNPSKVDDDTSKGATLFVVNPDIFYYALYFCYRQFDRMSLFQNFFTKFNYIIIDEFHYYDPKQFATFLFFLKLSKYKGYIDSSWKKRQFCILTATPHPQVEEYLNRLGIPIKWIDPSKIVPDDMHYIRSVRALTPVHLQVYSTEELKAGEQPGGLLQLVARQQQMIGGWLDSENDGAIISSSLGTINRIHHSLSSVISPLEEMGRITGAEQREGRREAKKRQLILATPTVDIGYNFDRPKPRQNIDFMLIDASSGDELIQRLGRAGRVLGKEQRERPSTVLAVVDPAFYQVLEQYDGQHLDRPTLRQLAADNMPARNSLYAYIKTGAIAEAFRPITFIGQVMPTTKLPDFEEFFNDLQRLFAEKATFTYQVAQRAVKAFEHRQIHYGKLRAIPKEAFDKLPLLVEGRLPGNTKFQVPATETCLEAFQERLKDEYKHHRNTGRNGREVLRWVQDDLRAYFIDKARFSFRDSFQPPLALVSDRHNLHSSRHVASYNALHIIKHYHARYYETTAEWEEAAETSVPHDASDALVYCSLIDLLDEPLQVGLKLNASEYTQDEWEDQFAYRVTALYGMEVVACNDHHGLNRDLQSLFSPQFVPAFVALNTTTSFTSSEIRKLQRRAHIFPMQLDVTFCDGRTLPYYVILGTMAFQVCAEIPRRSIAIDRRKTQLADDTPFIC